jgi:response regulator of citrate/malate metabolism
MRKSQHSRNLLIKISYKGVLEKELKSPLSAVILIAPNDRYTLGTFEFGALKYLIKPFNRKYFGETLEQAKSHIYSNIETKLCEKLSIC